MGGPTECWTLNISEWTGTRGPCPSDGGVSSLSHILETQPVPLRYYLSAKACAGILRRAAKRGKALPTLLRKALSAVAEGLSGREKREGKTRSLQSHMAGVTDPTPSALPRA